jgi:hypothetical protein
LLYDKDTKKFLGYIAKSDVMNEEALEKYKGTPVKALVKIKGNKMRFFDAQK